MTNATVETRIARPPDGEYLPYYGKYISLVPEGDIVETLRAQIGDTLALLRGIREESASYRYAPGKWSIKEVVGHMADVERVMAYRALRVARDDKTPLPGFDENAFVPAANFEERSLASLAHELTQVRAATVAFFETLNPVAATRRGTANDATITARALAYIIAGHERHHVALLKDRYLKS